MLNYVLYFSGAFILSFFLTLFFKFISNKFNILDQPGHRKIHSKPIPLMGGAAIYLSFTVALWFSGIPMNNWFAISLVGLVFILFGLLDDAGIKIRAKYKIFSHLAFSFLFVYLSGMHLDLFRYAWINWILTACFITFMTNSMNMLDGMDGLVAGISCIASVFFFLIALNNNLPFLAMISIIIAGATLGFLRYNFNSASIFLGEEGSTFLGYILAVLAINLKIYGLWGIALLLNIPRLQFIGFIVPLVIIGMPIFDTSFVFINRFLNKIKMSTPGKDHSHHRINMMGLSQKMTVLSLYSIQLILGGLALIMVNADLQQFAALLLILIVMAVSFWMFLLKVKVYPGVRSNDPFFDTP